MLFGVGFNGMWVALYEADFFDVRIFCVGHFMLPHHGVRRTTDRHKTPDSVFDSEFRVRVRVPVSMWGRRLAAERQEATATAAASSTKSAVFGELEQFSMRAACCFGFFLFFYFFLLFAAFCCASCRRFISSDVDSEVGIAIGDIENLQGISRSSHFAYVCVLCAFCEMGEQLTAYSIHYPHESKWGKPPSVKNGDFWSMNHTPHTSQHLLLELSCLRDVLNTAFRET